MLVKITRKIQSNHNSQKTNNKQITMTEIQNSKQLAFDLIRVRFLGFQLPIFIEQLANGCKVPKNKIIPYVEHWTMDVDVPIRNSNFRNIPITLLMSCNQFRKRVIVHRPDEIGATVISLSGQGPASAHRAYSSE